MHARHQFSRLLGAGLMAALAVGGLAVAAPTASAGVIAVDSSAYATPGGHGNFRWKYAAGAGHECRIMPVDRTAAVECDAKFARTTSSAGGSDAIRLLGPRVQATVNTSGRWAGVKRMAPYRQISVEGITCTVFEHASVTCTTRAGRFAVVGGVVR